MSIQTFTKMNIPTLKQISSKNFDEVIRLDPGSEHMTPNLKSIIEFINMDRKMTFADAVYIENKIIGFVMVDCENDKLKIRRFMIDKNYQSLGHGRCTMDVLLRKAFSIFDKYKEIYVTTRSDKAKDFYKKSGFCISYSTCNSGELPEYVLVLTKQSWWLDSVD